MAQTNKESSNLSKNRQIKILYYLEYQIKMPKQTCQPQLDQEFSRKRNERRKEYTPSREVAHTIYWSISPLIPGSLRLSIQETPTRIFSRRQINHDGNWIGLHTRWRLAPKPCQTEILKFAGQLGIFSIENLSNKSAWLVSLRTICARPSSEAATTS